MNTETELTCGDYIITQEDSRNWRVTKQTDRPMKDKDGNEKPGQFIVEFVGYYDGLPACLRAVLKDGYRDMGSIKIADVLKRYEELRAHVLATMKEVAA